MTKIGRNDPCPCGSGKKYKKCHMGKEDELNLNGLGEISNEMSRMITSLPEVTYGRAKKMMEQLDLEDLTGRSIGVKFVDLNAYSRLSIFGASHPKASEGKSGGVFINIYKTQKTDPDHIYIALSPNIDDSVLIHEIAHVIDYLGGSKLMPGALEPLSMELGVPKEHLEHTEEFAHWLKYLKDKFQVQPDADDAIILFLYQHGMLIRGKEIQEGNRLILTSKSGGIIRFLRTKSEEIDRIIRDLPGYIGKREPKG